VVIVIKDLSVCMITCWYHNISMANYLDLLAYPLILGFAYFTMRREQNIVAQIKNIKKRSVYRIS
jgi:Na+/serine symporter